MNATLKEALAVGSGLLGFVGGLYMVNTHYSNKARILREECSQELADYQNIGDSASLARLQACSAHARYEGGFVESEPRRPPKFDKK